MTKSKDTGRWHIKRGKSCPQYNCPGCALKGIAPGISGQSIPVSSWINVTDQAQIEVLKQLSDKLNVHTAKYHPDCPYCEVLELIDYQIKEIEK